MMKLNFKLSRFWFIDIGVTQNDFEENLISNITILDSEYLPGFRIFYLTKTYINKNRFGKLGYEV